MARKSAEKADGSGRVAAVEVGQWPATGARAVRRPAMGVLLG